MVVSDLRDPARTRVNPLRPAGSTALALAGLVAALLLAGCQEIQRRIEDYVAEPQIRKALGEMPEFRNDAQPVETIRVPMRDGIELETHVYRPQGAGPWPTIVVRDPYLLSKYVTCWAYVRYGYACVHQDVRGRHGSDGEWYPLLSERNDGIDTLAWVLAQPWQNGKLALSGESYVGLVQWAMADRLPPEVKTLVVNVAHGDFYEMVYRHEQFMPSIVGSWSAGLFAPMDEIPESMERWRARVLPARPPLSVAPEIFGPAWPSYRDYISHPSKEDPYWNSDGYRAIRDSHRGLDVPILWTARWYDFFLEGTLERFAELPARAESLLVIGPGDHSAKLGDLDLENASEGGFVRTIAWLDHVLLAKPRPDSLRPGFLVYEYGADRWRHADSWPPPTEPLRFELADLPRSRACDGGALVRAARTSTSADAISFTYDPMDPAPSRGGSWALSPELSPTANVEQGTDVCGRPDVLSFASEPLERPLHVTGSIHVRLDVSSDAVDTTFVARMSEVFADGRAVNIREDILPVSSGDRRPEGHTRLDFALVPIDWRTAVGSRLRLDVTSSAFPAFQPHPNTDALWSTVESPVSAEQTLHGGGVVLPVADLPSPAR